MKRISGTDLLVLAVKVSMMVFVFVAWRFGELGSTAAPYGSWVPTILLIGVGLLALFAVGLLAFPKHHSMVYYAMLPFDLAGLGLVAYATGGRSPMYVALVAEAVIYSLLFNMPVSGGAMLGASVAWAAATIWPGKAQFGLTATHMLQSFGLVAIGTVAYSVVHRERQQHSRWQSAADDLEEANRELSKRVIELNAISEIAVAIHSTLDFDQVGRLVLEILQKVLNLKACSLMIIDRQAGETVFTASQGLSNEIGEALAYQDLGTEGAESADGMLRCIPLLQHEKITAVLCTDGRSIDQFTEDDMLVLSAIASELAVAIENAQLYKLTKRLSMTDELTGLYNYRYLRQRIELEIERAQRYLRPVSLIMLDLDDFKAHNDTYGHGAGDRALAEVAQVFQSKVRDLDVVARYGGEEFSIVLPETDASGAFVVAEKVREAVSFHRFAGEEGLRNVHITVSLGVATYPIHASNAEELLRQADDAVYRAKTSGRNKVCSPPKEMATK